MFPSCYINMLYRSIFLFYPFTVAISFKYSFLHTETLLVFGIYKQQRRGRFRKIVNSNSIFSYLGVSICWINLSGNQIKLCPLNQVQGIFVLEFFRINLVHHLDKLNRIWFLIFSFYLLLTC